MSDTGRLKRGGVAGHHFRGYDLTVWYHAGPVFLAEKWRCFAGVKIRVDSWCEPRCERCGCQPTRHAQGCPKKAGAT